MRKPLSDQTEPELSVTMIRAANAVKDALPPKTLFVVLAFEAGPGVAQYIANAERADMIKMLRETADRIELRQDVTR